MELKYKKIIARELLCLTAAISLSVIAYFCVYPYNSYYQRQAALITDSSFFNTKLGDSLGASFKTKQQQQDWFTDQYTAKFHLTNSAKYRQEIWNHMQQLAEQNNIGHQWQTLDPRIINFLREIKINSAAQFQTFIQQNIITDSDKQNKLAAEKTYAQPVVVDKGKEAVKEKILSSSEQMNFAENVFFLMIILFFGVRYLVYFIKWCVVTLQQDKA
jgi:hypothetical protein